MFVTDNKQITKGSIDVWLYEKLCQGSNRIGVGAFDSPPVSFERPLFFTTALFASPSRAHRKVALQAPPMVAILLLDLLAEVCKWLFLLAAFAFHERA